MDSSQTVLNRLIELNHLVPLPAQPRFLLPDLSLDEVLADDLGEDVYR